MAFYLISVAILLDFIFEFQVDLLGDEVDALLSLLEKIYIALDHYSPILQHYPGVRFFSPSIGCIPFMFWLVLGIEDLLCGINKYFNFHYCFLTIIYIVESTNFLTSIIVS